MSLYDVQKLLYQLNRDPRVRKRFDEDCDDAARRLRAERRGARRDRRRRHRLALRAGRERPAPDALRGAARHALGRLHRGDARRRAQARAGARRALRMLKRPASMSDARDEPRLRRRLQPRARHHRPRRISPTRASSDALLRELERLRERLEAREARRADRRRRRALRELLHEQHAGLLRSAWPTTTKARSRTRRGSASSARAFPGNADAVAPPHRRRDAGRRRRLRRGVEVRPRHHGAAALPDAALRPAGHPRQHQLPGPAADAAQARLGVRRGAAPRLRRACPSGSRSSAPAASRTGRRRPTRERSTRPGTASSSTAGRATTATALLAYTRRGDLPRSRPGRLRDPHLHRRRRRRAAAAASCCFYAPIPIFSVGCTVATMTVR